MCCSYTYWNVLHNADTVDVENSYNTTLRMEPVCVSGCVCACVCVCVIMLSRFTEERVVIDDASTHPLPFCSSFKIIQLSKNLSVKSFNTRTSITEFQSRHLNCINVFSMYLLQC